MVNSARMPSSLRRRLADDEGGDSPKSSEGDEKTSDGGNSTSSSSPPPSEESSPPPPNDESPPPADESPPPPKESSPPPETKASSPPPESKASPSPPPDEASPSPPPAEKTKSPTPENQSPPSSNPASPPPASDSPQSKSPPATTASPSPTTTTQAPPGQQSSLAPPQQPGVPSPPGTWYSPPKSSSSSAPPPPRHSSSGSSKESGSSKSNSSTSSETTTKAVVGVALASVFLLALVAIVLVCKWKKKRRQDAYTTTNYMPPHFTGKPATCTNSAYFFVNVDGYNYYGQQPHSHIQQYSGNMDPYQTSSQSQYSHSYGSPKGGPAHYSGPDSGVISGGKSFFTYEELMEVTGGFARENIIGEGGFGCVFKGTLPGGKLVAVKQLKAGSGQGEREFRAEVEIISRVHHRHLVTLEGYSVADAHRSLIYEFIPNDTLEHHLHDPGAVLPWSERLKIAIGAAKGLAYLHEDCHPKIIHRDIKSANILLENDFEAKVADFGLARLNDTTQTHVSTRVMGTFGYLAPEYASSGKLTDRSDVFSFGVVLLELITGRKPVDPQQPLGDESLVEWARPVLVKALQTGDISELVDPRLGKNYVESEVLRMIEAAAACVRHSGPKRPRMIQVVRALDSDSESDLSNGVKYGQSTVYDSAQYNEDIMKFRRMALGSETSSEYDMLSGDYTSKTVTHGSQNTGKDSSEFTSGEQETRAMNYKRGPPRL
ncbi:hypothetical protein ACFE04_022985 [Oxalis oulophora]